MPLASTETPKYPRSRRVTFDKKPNVRKPKKYDDDDGDGDIDTMSSTEETTSETPVATILQELRERRERKRRKSKAKSEEKSKDKSEEKPRKKKSRKYRKSSYKTKKEKRRRSNAKTSPLLDSATLDAVGKGDYANAVAGVLNKRASKASRKYKTNPTAALASTALVALAATAAYKKYAADAAKKTEDAVVAKQAEEIKKEEANATTAPAMVEFRAKKYALHLAQAYNERKNATWLVFATRNRLPDNCSKSRLPSILSQLTTDVSIEGESIMRANVAFAVMRKIAHAGNRDHNADKTINLEYLKEVECKDRSGKVTKVTNTSDIASQASDVTDLNGSVSTNLTVQRVLEMLKCTTDENDSNYSVIQLLEDAAKATRP